MIDEPTLFILGAGSSRPYGFPTGRELRSEIIRSFSADYTQLLSSVSSQPPIVIERRLEQVNEFVGHFSESSVYSIDQYLAINPMYQPHGKMAIAYYIRKKEIESKFREELTSPFYEEDWYSLIFNRMIAGLKQPQDFGKFNGNKVAFITFNYDRSLEYFLYTSFLNTFWQSQGKFKDELTNYIPFPIIHVYGQVGWWGPLWEENLIYYRESSISFDSIAGLSKQIHIIGGKAVEELKEEIARLISEYTRIFFCGFAYAKENLEVIGYPKEEIVEPYKIYGTAKGMTPKEIRGVRGSLVRNVPSHLTDFLVIEDKNTYDLLREHL